MKKLLFYILTSSVVFGALAQNGYLRGKITDGETGEGLFGATVTKLGTTIGSVSDFDGNFSLALEPGVHTVTVQFVSFKTVTIEGVEIKAGEVNTLDVTLNSDVQELESVVVTAAQIKDNDMAIMSVQRKSTNTLDGISSASFRKIGDSNLGGAMKRVTGVTVQGGKYVYVRGLGDRYTKVALNGMVIPGLDPDRNDVQIDIFPTSILENVMVYKTFTPNLNGDFAGGLINIETKSFPETKETKIQVGFGYNPAMHFNSNAVSYDGSSTDWLGYDNGDRELPIGTNANLSTLANEGLGDTTRMFSPQLGTNRGKNFMNTNFSVVHRNQIQGEKLTWGYNLIMSYKSDNTFYEGYTVKRYELDRTSADLQLERDFTGGGDMSNNSVLWSGLAGISVKGKNFTIGNNLLRIQNGQKIAVDRVMKFTALNNPTTIYNDILAYTERTMTNNMTFGKHQIGNLKLNWTNSFLSSSLEDPDYRDTRINKNDDGSYGFRNGGSIDRFWRDLKEVNETFKVDFTLPVGGKNNVKFGTLGSYSNRDFNVYSFNYAPIEVFKVTYNDANWLLQEENLYSAENPNGLYIQDNSNDFNNYEGKQTIFAGYLMNEMQVTDKLKSTYGARLEKTDMFYDGVRLNEDNTLVVENNTHTLDNLNVLPSLGMIYSFNEDMNVRASVNKTLARPSFKEKSSAYIEDPITRTRFSGNLDLKQAQIMNYDFRWEYFYAPGQMTSVSFFYKDFTDHIALVFYPNSPGQLKPRNVGQARIYGTEFELRKDLNFAGNAFKGFSVGTNLSFVISRVDRQTVKVSDSGESEYDSEVSYRGTDAGVKRYRQMTGQSPYVINGFLNYDNDKLGITGNLSYNVQGETMTFVGTSNVPNVFTQPFNSLNMKVSKNFGPKGNSNLSLRIENILNDQNEMVYKSGSETELFQVLKPGRTYTLTYGFSF